MTAPEQGSTYFRKGFGLKGEVEATLAADYDGSLVDLLRARDHSLTIGGVSVTPKRMGDIEKALIGQTASEELFRELCEQCRNLDAIDDVHAPASYRQHLATVMARRALVAAHGRVGRA